MVQYVINEHDIRYGLVESLRRLTHDIVVKDTRKKMLLLFLVTLVISILDFVLTNIAIIRISNVLQLYLYQFMILSIVDSLYAPFFLVCLFLLHHQDLSRLNKAGNAHSLFPLTGYFTISHSYSYR
jgi:sugar phosphate permease